MDNELKQQQQIAEAWAELTKETAQRTKKVNVEAGSKEAGVNKAYDEHNKKPEDIGLKNKVRGGILLYLKMMSSSSEVERKKALLKLGKRMAEFVGINSSVKDAFDGLGFSPEMKIQATEVIQQAFEENMINGASETEKNYNFYDLAVATEASNKHFWDPVLKNAETPPEKIYLKVKRRKIEEYGSVEAADKAAAEQRRAIKKQRRAESNLKSKETAAERVLREANERKIEKYGSIKAADKAIEKKRKDLIAAVREKRLAKKLALEAEQERNVKEIKALKKKKRFAKLGKFFKRAVAVAAVAIVVVAGVFGMKDYKKVIGKKAKEHKEIVVDSVKNNVIVEDINDITIGDNEVILNPDVVIEDNKVILNPEQDKVSSEKPISSSNHLENPYYNQNPNPFEVSMENGGGAVDSNAVAPVFYDENLRPLKSAKDVKDVKDELAYKEVIKMLEEKKKEELLDNEWNNGKL
ncbi:MAG: hypothetical protein ACTSXL_01105 [Alphaproteobacteria bacterium]